MGESFGDLLERFLNTARDPSYASDPDRAEAMMAIMEDVMQAMLEKLRDRLDPA